MPEEDTEFALQEIATAHSAIKPKLVQYGQILQAAEKKDWDPTLMAEAQAVLEEAEMLRARFQELLARVEERLESEGIDLQSIAAERDNSQAKERRLWKSDLTPEQVGPTGRTIEQRLADGLGSLLKYVPLDWWQDQLRIRKALGEDFLSKPLILYGSHDCRGLPSEVHRYGYALILSKDILEDHEPLDMFNAASLVPVTVALCDCLSAIESVKGGAKRLELLAHLKNQEVDSAIYELITAARMAQRGRDVELLEPQYERTADIRIHDLPVPAVAECKRLSRLSAYEEREISRIGEIFHQLRDMQVSSGLVGHLSLDYDLEVDAVPTADVVNAVVDSLKGSLAPTFDCSVPWGRISFGPLVPSKPVAQPTTIYSPHFLEQVFGWQVGNDDYDGVCAFVTNDRFTTTARAELPFCIRWKVNDQRAVNRKARSIVSHIKEAAEQVPAGEGGFIYIAFEDSLRPSLADHRTKRVLELTDDFYLKWRHARVLRIVVNRLYPTSLGKGRPDLVESSIPLSLDDEDVWGKYLPTCVYTGADSPREGHP